MCISVLSLILLSCFEWNKQYLKVPPSWGSCPVFMLFSLRQTQEKIDRNFTLSAMKKSAFSLKNVLFGLFLFVFFCGIINKT
jgi:hypothetical protein